MCSYKCVTPSAPCHFHCPPASRKPWHFIKEPHAHIIKNNLCAHLHQPADRDSPYRWMFTHTCMDVNVSAYTLCSVKKDEQSTISGEFISLSLSLASYCLCDSWPRGHLPHCAFVPLPIQHYLKPNAAAAAQHNHCKLPLVAAKSAFQQGNSHCSRVEWQ